MFTWGAHHWLAISRKTRFMRGAARDQSSPCARMALRAPLSAVKQETDREVTRLHRSGLDESTQRCRCQSALRLSTVPA